MKTKIFLLSLLLGAGLASCSDDEIKAGAENGQNGKGAPAYLMVSFGTNGNSSRAANDNNTGDPNTDKDNNTAEDSGHHSTGTADEQEIKSVLILARPQNATTGAKSQTVLRADLSTSTADGVEYYTPIEPMELTIGSYDVIVIVNPSESFKDKTDDECYNIALTGTYANSTATTNDAAVEGLKSSGFQMTNRELGEVTLNTTNTIESPAPVTVNVERTLSKITFRNTVIKKDGEDLSPNIYPVQVKVGGKVTGETVTGTIEWTDGETKKTEENVTLYVAKDKLGNIVYIHYVIISLNQYQC